MLAAGLLPGLAAAPAGDRSFDGIILPFKEIVVSSPVESSIDGMFVKEGDRVEAGQTMAHLYAKIQELDMLRAKADLEKKEFEFKGAKNLYADKIISEDEALKNKIEQQLSQLQYEMALETFRQRAILAPIAGIVVEKLRELGESVTPAQPMFRIVDISEVYAQFFIRAEDLPLIHIGDTVSVRCPSLDPGRASSGKVVFVDPRVDAASGLMRVKVLLPNPDGWIKSGVQAEVSLGHRE